MTNETQTESKVDRARRIIARADGLRAEAARAEMAVMHLEVPRDVTSGAHVIPRDLVRIMLPALREHAAACLQLAEQGEAEL